MPVSGVPQYGGVGEKPSCFTKVRMGFGMGFMIGMSTGVLIGGFQAFRFGARGRELVKVVAKSMFQAGGSFGTFMAVGSALRC